MRSDQRVRPSRDKPLPDSELAELNERSLNRANNEVFLCSYDLHKAPKAAKLLDKNACHVSIRVYGKEYSQNRDTDGGVTIELAVSDLDYRVLS